MIQLLLFASAEAVGYEWPLAARRLHPAVSKPQTVAGKIA